MELNSKLEITTEELTINLKFYRFLKILNGTDGIKGKLLNEIQETIFLYEKSSNLENLKELISHRITVSRKKPDNLLSIIDEINNQNDLYIYKFSLKLLEIKDLLLAQAKINNYELIISKDIHPLSLKYDHFTCYRPYYSRVKGALLSCLFFELASHKEFPLLALGNKKYMQSLLDDYEYLKEIGINHNQIFMLIFNESMNQSIKSSAGSSYENRVLDVLCSQGLKRENIQKKHDDQDTSTEFDFFFTLSDRKFGIGAKRTLRERYKQFIKTIQMAPLDVMITITLGIDLSQDKLKAIENHGVYLFIADEEYESQQYFQESKITFPCSQLTIETLANLKPLAYKSQGNEYEIFG